MTGPELAVQVRAKHPEVAMIAVSGQEAPEMIRQIAAQGMFTFLRKPFPMRELIRAIAQARGSALRSRAAANRR
jgi:DNA-binding NtrC family response regulator